MLNYHYLFEYSLSYSLKVCSWAVNLQVSAFPKVINYAKAENNKKNISNSCNHLIHFPNSTICKKIFCTPSCSTNIICCCRKFAKPSICQADQFNHTKSQKLGYGPTIYNIFAGILDGKNTTSWNGKDGNLTYKELESIVFDYDYTKFKVIGEYGTSKEYILMLPYGICLKLSGSKSSSTIWIGTKQKVHMFLADPYRANDIWTEKLSDTQTTLGPSSDNYYEHAVFEVDYTVDDASIHDGKICTDYTKKQHSYQHCISTIAINEFKSWYGCFPPWFFWK